MVTGILRIELFIPESGSLKTKRYALKSLKDRLRNRYNLSIAEVDNGDKWQRATLGLAVVSNESRHVESILSKALNLVDGDSRVQVIDVYTEYVQGQIE